MENRIISLNLNTKIQYSLFNFFAPIGFTAVLITSFGFYNIKATLIAFLSIIIGLCCLIINVIKYNRYIVINDDSLNICTGKKNPKIIHMIKKSELKNKRIDYNLQHIDFNLSIKKNNKKITLLHIIPSITGLICWIGPLIFIPILKRNNVLYNKLTEIKALFPELVQGDVNKLKSSNTLSDVLMWGFVLFVCAVGCIGILLSPFYAFLG